MTFSVYVLYSRSHNKIYIGYTSDLEKRLLSHNQLATKGYTVRYRPWTLIYTEVFGGKSEAMKREKSLKSGKGREFIWQLVRNSSEPPIAIGKSVGFIFTATNLPFLAACAEGLLHFFYYYNAA